MDMVTKERKQYKFLAARLRGRVMAVCLMISRYLTGLPLCRNLASCQTPAFRRRSCDPVNRREAPYLFLPAAGKGRSRASPRERKPFPSGTVP